MTDRKYHIALCFLALFFHTSIFSQTPLFTNIPVSDVGQSNNIGKANTSRNIAVDQAGNIYVVFTGTEGIRVSRSTNRGENFSPSVLVKSFNAEPEIAVNAEGIIFVAWIEGTSIKLSRSEDQGATFSQEATVGVASLSSVTFEDFETVHIATYNKNIYISDRSGENVYINPNNGIGSFSNIKLPNFAYSDILTDLNGIVYAPRDNPTLDLYSSNDSGNTFAQIPIDNSNSVFFSSYTFSDGPCGTYIFVAGSDSVGYKIDVTDGSTSQLIFGTNGTTPHGRTLFADSQGTLIDGYQNFLGELLMSVSFNQGETFNPPIVIATGDSHNIDRNTANNDIVVAYASGGQVFVSVYDNLLKSITITDPVESIDLCSGQDFDLSFALTGSFDANTTFSAVLSDATGSFANSTIIENIITNSDTTISITLPTDLTSSDQYRLLIESVADCTQSQPVSINITTVGLLEPDDLFECVDDSSTATFDLTENAAIVIADQTGYEISYYTSESDANAVQNAIVNPENYVSNDETIWIRVENEIIATCYGIISFNITAYQLPIINDTVRLEQCDINQDGITLFNLAEANSLIATSTDYKFTYYTSLSDAETELEENQITNFTSYSNPTPLNSKVYARVETVNGCHRVSEITLSVEATQIPDDFQLIFESCDDNAQGNNIDGISSFNFSSAIAQVEGLFPIGQNLETTFYLNETDALQEQNQITNLTNYRNDLSPNSQIIWIRVDNTDINGCQGLGAHVLLQVKDVPLNNSITDYPLCNSDGSATFDLTTKNAEVIGVQTESIFVKYYETYQNAQDDVPIVDPTNYVSTGQTIYIRSFFDVNNNGSEEDLECYNSTDMQFDLIVYPNYDFSAPEPIEICSNQINTLYDLTLREGAIINGNADLTINYYESQLDVDNDSPITDPSNYLNTQLTKDIIVVVTTINNCPTQQLLQLRTTLYENYNFTPQAIEECEVDNDGYDSFDITRVEADILNLLDGDTGNDLNLNDHLFTYYTSETDANLIPEDTSKAIQNPSAFINTSINSQTIYTRVVPANNPNLDCFAVIPVTIIVNAVPEIAIADEYVICLAGDGNVIPAIMTTFLPNPPIDTQLNETEYSFKWYNGNLQDVTNDPDAFVILGETGSTFNATEIGDYTVIATNRITGCTIPASTIVVESYPPERITLELASNLFSGNNVLEVSVVGNGNYEYSLDGGPWGIFSSFENVTGGEHTVSVRDLYNCNVLIAIKNIIDYPLYFTPNGDGMNDTWNIKSIADMPNAKIFVFNRYGKLIKQLSPLGNGWDGTYNGSKMPSSDYWFVVEYNEPSDNTRRNFKAHFTLKR